MLEEGGGRGAQGARRGRQTNCSKALVHEEWEVPSKIFTFCWVIVPVSGTLVCLQLCLSPAQRYDSPAFNSWLIPIAQFSLKFQVLCGACSPDHLSQETVLVTIMLVTGSSKTLAKHSKTKFFVFSSMSCSTKDLECS